MKIRNRIVALVLVILILMLSAFAFSLREMVRLGDQVHRVSAIFVPLSTTVSSVVAFQVKQSLAFERAMLWSRQATLNLSSPLESEFIEAGASVHTALRRAKRILSSALSEPHRPEMHSLLKELDTSVRAAGSTYDHYSKEATVLLARRAEASDDEISASLMTLAMDENELRKAISAILQQIYRATLDASDEAAALEQRARSRISEIAFAAFVIGLSLAFVVTSSITEPLAVAARVTNEIAKGNRNAAIPPLDDSEIGQLLRALKEMQEAVQRSEESLASRAEELARSNAELEQFAYSASHDLQEPLRMISGYVELLQKRYSDKLDAQAHEFMQFAIDGVQRMRALINALLYYSRAGREIETVTEVPLARVVDRTLMNLRPLIEENQAKITASSLPTVRGDEIRLIQLFQNLLSNALKFRGEATPQITISAEREDDFWKVSVADNGIGIGAHYAAKLFQLFSRAPTAKQVEGHGIGLATCKKIVEGHGGTIGVSSQPEQGSTFFFTLPAA